MYIFLYFYAPRCREKTYLLNLLLNEIWRTKNIDIVVSSSRIPATLLTGDRKTHQYIITFIYIFIILTIILLQ